MSTNTQSGGLAKKLASILGEVAHVPKTGYNAFHKYNYVTESDLVDAVRKKLAEKSVFIFTSVTKQTTQVVTDEQSQKQSMLTLVETLHTFVDGDSGESFSVAGTGQGADRGDKGVYKAITGAMKYFLYKNFLISTNDDPEGDEGTDKRAAGQGTGSGGGQRQTPAGASGGPAAGKAPAFHVLDPKKPQDWMNVAVPIKNSADYEKKLGELDAKHVEEWAAKWKPKGKAPDLLNLRAALDQFTKEKMGGPTG